MTMFRHPANRPVGPLTPKNIAHTPNFPTSPQAILTEDRRPVKALLGEFNMQRSVAKLVKGAHRRLGLDDRKEGSSSSVTH